MSYEPRSDGSENPYRVQPPYAPQYIPTASGPATSRTSGLAIASLVTGILSIPLLCCCGVFSAPVGVAAIGLGVFALKQVNQGGLDGKALSIIGISMGGADVLIAIGWLIFAGVSTLPYTDITR